MRVNVFPFCHEREYFGGVVSGRFPKKPGKVFFFNIIAIANLPEIGGYIIYFFPKGGGGGGGFREGNRHKYSMILLERGGGLKSCISIEYLLFSIMCNLMVY